MINRYAAMLLQLLRRVTTPAVKSMVYRAFFRTPAARAEPPRGAAILQEARAHFEACADLSSTVHGIAAGALWTGFRACMQEQIRRFTTCREAIRFAQTEVAFDHRFAILDHAHLFSLHEATLANEFPHFAGLLEQLGDSPYSRPETMLQLGERLLSNVFFYHLNYLMQCLSWVPQPDVVCEIGGGYGAPARLWLLNPVHPVKTYIIVDFPESLFFAEVFLKANFETLNLHYVTSARLAESDFREPPRVILCPIHHAASLAHTRLDLVVNTGSMQEMTDEWIDFWMEWLRRQDVRFFYSLNWFALHLDSLVDIGNAWCPRLTPEWTVRLCRANPAFVMQQTSLNTAELLAEKTGVTPLAQPALRARYEQARARVLHPQALLECMDIVRLDPGEDIVWDLLQRAVALRSIPREARFLAASLTRTASAEFRSAHGARLAEIVALLDRFR